MQHSLNLLTALDCDNAVPEHLQSGEISGGCSFQILCVYIRPDVNECLYSIYGNHHRREHARHAISQNLSARSEVFPFMLAGKKEATKPCLACCGPKQKYCIPLREMSLAPSCPFLQQRSILGMQASFPAKMQQTHYSEMEEPHHGVSTFVLPNAGKTKQHSFPMLLLVADHATARSLECGIAEPHHDHKFLL